MFQVLSCVANDHDFRLVILAAAVCLLSALTAMGLFQRARNSSGRMWITWLSLDAVAAGFGIWATHFIAMLAYEPGVGVKYDLVLTVASLLVAILMTGAGQMLVAAGHRRTDILLGGGIVGLGIICMHYTGMTALQIPGRIQWDYRYVGASVVIGLILASSSFYCARNRKDLLGIIASSLLFTLAVVGMHFTAMTAIHIEADPTIAFKGISISPVSLSLLIAGTATIILCGCLLAALFDWRTQDALQIQKQRLDAALENMSQGLCMFDAKGNVLLFNDRYAEITGVPADQLRGATLLDIIQRQKTGIKGANTEEFAADVIASANAGKEMTSLVERNDGRTLRVVAHPMEGGGWVATLEDITEWQKAQAQISHMARHDALTNLPNRTLFRERLEAALLRTGRGEQVAVLCLDLDRFKAVNDTLGHPIGDELLREIAVRLLDCVREGDTVARLGGDEFAIIQAAKDLVVGQVATLANRLVETLCEPYTIKGHQIVTGTSIGISFAPNDGVDPDELLRSADLALYRAKLDGRGVYRFFEPGMDARAQARRMMELQLRSALAREEFELYYQPIHNLKSGRITTFEALIRWNHPVHGMVQPGEFIPLAEETGLIVSLGDWVLRKACADAAAWSRPVAVAVNISPVQFKGRNLYDSAVAALADSGLPANRLELEITEAVLLQQTESTLATLHRLRDLGVRISMDDFGTGYSSLSYLRSFPFDRIKIDRSFTKDIDTREDAAAIVRAVAGLGTSLGIPTIAEGVETAEQLNLLRKEGCSEVQGFHFGKPRPGCEVERFLERDGAPAVAHLPAKRAI